MAIVFSKSLRSLEGDRFRVQWVMIVASVGLLAAWGVWFCMARVGVYELSSEARLEVLRAAHPVEAPVSGIAVRTYLEVGRQVEVGTPLVELDATALELERREIESRRAAMSTQIAALREEIEAERRGAAEFEIQAEAARNEAAARIEEARVAHEVAELNWKRIQDLDAKGRTSPHERLLAEAEVRQRLAAAHAAEHAATGLHQQHKIDRTSRAVRIESLEREIARLEGEKNAAAQAIERLDHLVQDYRIAASASGVLGEVADLNPGAFVQQGQRLATIVPPGRMQVIAQFAPGVLARIQPGQTGRISFVGFPASQYGTVGARVTRVAGEVRDGRVRVELDVLDGAEAGVPLQHGMPCRVDVCVEHVSPAAWVLRAAGRRIDRARLNAQTAGVTGIAP